MADGTRLKPIPIARFRCPVHGTTSWLPAFLNRYLHYVAEVVSQVLSDFVNSRMTVLCDGPAEGTLGRWVRWLLDARGESWLHRRLEETDPRWQTLIPPEASPTRLWAWLILQAALCLTRLTRPTWAQHLFSPLLQLARLASH